MLFKFRYRWPHLFPFHEHTGDGIFRVVGDFPPGGLVKVKFSENYVALRRILIRSQEWESPRKEHIEHNSHAPDVNP